MLGAAVAIVPTLAGAAPSEVKLEVNENCQDPEWQCWTSPGGSTYTPSVRIASGGVVKFADETGFAAAVVWTSTPGPQPSCQGVPTSPEAHWHGECKFEQPGTYRFESSTLFKDAYENYRKYEIVVEGASTGTTGTTTTSTTPTTTLPTTTMTSPPPPTTTSTQPSGGGDPTGTTAASPSEAKLEVNENCVEPEWPCWTAPGSKPEPASKVTIAAGGEVMFTDHATTPAAVVWMGSAPVCTGVPTSATTGWEGKCKFEQPGTYKFESSTLFIGDGLNYTMYEIVVEGAGTTPTTPSSPGGGGTTSPPGPAGGSGSGAAPGSPLVGSSSEAVKLARVQHGSSVRGSVKISQAGVGGRLEIDLLASGASLAKAGHSPQARVGRLVRSSLYAGTTSFTVPLNAKGKAALRRHRRLALTVRIVLTPVHGAVVTVTKSLVLHA